MSVAGAPAAAPVRVLVPVADGSEDLEFATITDVLVRCGVEVVTASVSATPHVTLARGLRVTASTTIDAVIAAGGDFSAVVLPGGMPGSKHLSESAPLIALIKETILSRGRLLGAVCAAPVVALLAHGLLAGVDRMTCFPLMKDKIAPSAEATAPRWLDEAVVVARSSRGGSVVITSQGPGTSLHFALQIAAHLTSPDVAAGVAKGMLVHDFRAIQVPTSSDL